MTPSIETSSTPRTTSAASITPGVFPKPTAIETQVAFWRNVYGVWSRSQVALHDNRFLDVIYEVIQLPGDITEGYTPSQKELVRERTAYWQSRLRDLEQKVAAGMPLAPNDQRLVSKISPRGNLKTALQGASDRLRGQRGLRERFKRGLEISGRYDHRFRDIFRQAGLPEDLAYLPHVESSFQTQARSSAGAVGIWQFTRAAAERFMSVNMIIDERLDPIASAHGAARYLSHAYSKLGSWPLAVTSYNHGVSGMLRAKQYFGNDFMRIVYDYDHPQFGFASRNFYAEFLAAREVARQPERFFPEGLRYEKPLDWDRVILTQNALVSTLSRQYDTDKSQLIALNAAWTEPAKSERAALPAGTAVWLPSGTLRQIAYRSQQNRLVAREREDGKASPNVKVNYPGNRKTPSTGTPIYSSSRSKNSNYKLVKTRTFAR
ncbi:lytic transglycosylase domain-containing protein [Methylocaldum sp.]|uniref:lytic transglycosylase domain-containing protein n=1 Tax=Methylocaldum sp. TaxID=1969727 RepID=UPI002D705FA8|nr:lytic transglycosylase domain-containing protein [Methylocaldum sp.]HYE37835.1 lytic transglycosylase domain-containing protein [Methylocaldum sp.]